MRVTSNSWNATDLKANAVGPAEELDDEYDLPDQR
jgi:hypothetical protein